MTLTGLDTSAICHSLDLKRETWQGTGAMVLVPADGYPALEGSHANFLGPRETATLRSLNHERRRASFLLGRYAAKTALGQVASAIDPRDIDIVAGCFQQPVVESAHLRSLGVSISHSAHWACAVAYPESHPLGVDVEDIDGARADVMATQFTERELTIVNADGADRAALSAVIWTAKESLSKILRCGMMVPFSLLETTALEAVAGGYRGVFTHFSQYAFLARVRQRSVVTLTLPRKTTLGGDSFFGI